MVSLDVTIVNVALPTLSRELDASLPQLQWIVDGYALTFAAVLLTGGALGDALGVRRVFSVGLVLFSAASAACGLAPSIGWLILARFVQGLGAALLVPCSLALLRNAYGDERGRARAVAVWAAAGGAAIAAGPVVGGVLIHALGWRSIFLINLLVGGAMLALTMARVVSVSPKRRRIDVAGQLIAVIAVAGVTFALIEGPRMGWTDRAVVTAIAAALLGLIAFALCERSVADPMLPPKLVRRPAFAGSAIVGGLLNLAFYGEVFVLSLFFQQARGESPLAAGLSFLPMTGLITLSNLVAPRLAQRIGSIRTIVIGELVLGGGMAAVIAIDAHSPWWAISLTLLPIGIGGGLSIPPLTHRLLESVPGTLAGVASGGFNASRQVGGAIGVALFGALLPTHGSGFTAGMRITLALSVAAMLAAALLTKLLVGRPTRAEDVDLTGAAVQTP